MMKCDCGGEFKYQFSASKDDHIHKVYECSKCKETHVDISYKYKSYNCPKHHWEFDRWGFKDGVHDHEIFWLMKCDRCGAEHKRRFDSGEVGLREAVQLEDPRVLSLLDLNKDTARFHLGKDAVKDFWE